MIVCYFIYAFYAYGPEGNMLWAGRRLCCVMDRKVGVGRTGRFTQQGRKSPETHGPEGQGLERRICGWYSGGISLSFRAYSCGFMFSGSQEVVARQRRDRTVPRVGVL